MWNPDMPEGSSRYWRGGYSLEKTRVLPSRGHRPRVLEHCSRNVGSKKPGRALSKRTENIQTGSFREVLCYDLSSLPRAPGPISLSVLCPFLKAAWGHMPHQSPE